LRYTANEDDVEGIYKLYAKMDKVFIHGETDAPSYYDLFASKIGYEPLPDDFDLFIVRKNQLGTDALAGIVSGLAISRQRNEVIFFYENLS
jgi:hypothetical protein